VGERVVVVRKQMSIRVHRRADVGVTDVALNPKGMGALIDQEGDACVPHPVRSERPQAGLRYARVPEANSPAVVIETPAVGRREDEL
jgi:hypothetical protein